MRLLSFLSPIVPDHISNQSGQRVAFGHRKVSLLVLGENSQHKHGQALATEQINNSSAAALAAAAKTKPHFTNAAAAGNDHTACGVRPQGDPRWPCVRLAKTISPHRRDRTAFQR